MNRQSWLLALFFAAAVGMVAHAPARAQKKPAPKKPAAKSAATKVTRKQAQAMLRVGYDALKANQTKVAVTEFSRALNSGKLRRNEMAKALYYRGRTYRSLKQPANAISDLTSALWLKGALSKIERKEALQERQLAYKDAGVGVGVNSGAVPAPQVSALSKAPTATVARRKPNRTGKPGNVAWQTSTRQTGVPSTTGSTQSTTATGSTNSITSFFGNLFGSGQQPKPAVVAARTPAPQSAVASSWSTGTKPAGRAARRTKNKTSRRAAVKPTPARARYLVQIASYRNQAQASTLARRIGSRHAKLLRGRRPAVEQQAVGNMGTFYHVRVRNWPTAKSPAGLCKKLLASGLDCLVIKTK